MHTHTSHPDILGRLRAAEADLKNIIMMMECDAHCAELAQRMHVLEQRINSAKKILVHEHLSHCLHETARGTGTTSDEAVREYKRLIGYL